MTRTTMAVMTHAGTRAPLPRWQAVLIATVTITVCAILIAYGAAGSYESLSHLAAAVGAPLPQLVPVGLDGGLVGLIVIDILLTWIGMPRPGLRQSARLFAVGTLAANCAAGWPSPVGVLLRVFAPALIIVITEAIRAVLLGRQNEQRDAVPFARWALSPLPTFRLWRRMVLGNVTSYARAVELENARLHARDLLRAAREADPAPVIPAALRRAVRTGRLPAAVTAAVDSGDPCEWEPEVASWVTSRLTLSDRLAAQLRDERKAITAPAREAIISTPPEAIAEVPSAPPAATPLEAPPAPALEAPPEASRKPSATALQRVRRAGRKATDELLLEAIAEMASEGASVTKTRLVRELPVGEPRAARLMEAWDARLHPKPHLVTAAEG